MTTRNQNFVIKPGKPQVRPTFQFHGTAQGDSHETFESIVSVVIRWLDQKYPEALPESCTAEKCLDHSHFGQSVGWVLLENPTTWSCRLSQPDAPFNNKPAVAGRTWITEISVRLGPSSIDVFTKVLCSSLDYGSHEITFTRPRFLLDLKTVTTFTDIVELSSVPLTVDSENSYQTFKKLLLDNERKLPILVLTQPQQDRFGVPVSDYLLDGDTLARKLEFSAHVIHLSSEYCFRLTDDMTRVWSVFGGAARLYWPISDYDLASPYDHKLYLPNNILFWKTDEGFAENAFEKYIHDTIIDTNSRRDFNMLGPLSYEQARMTHTEMRISNAKSDSELIPLYEEEIQNLKIMNQKLEQDVAESLELARGAEIERNELKADLEKTKMYAESLRRAIEYSTGTGLKQSIKPGETYDELSSWVIQNLHDWLELHPRASKGIKNARYENVEAVYVALIELAFSYRDMRLGKSGAKEKFEREISGLSMNMSKSISIERAGEERDQYYVEHPVGSGRKRFIKWHLRKGTSQDERYCLRIYFFWDETKDKVIVCWLPSHLDNRFT